MHGDVGSYVMAASKGSPVARQLLSGVFSADFQNWGGWTEMLDQMPGGRVEEE